MRWKEVGMRWRSGWEEEEGEGVTDQNDVAVIPSKAKCNTLSRFLSLSLSQYI